MDIPSNKATAERVSKLMARAGVCSRRAAEELILSGKVLVNGKPHVDPGLRVPLDATILVKGKPLPQDTETPRLFLFHKPLGLITTHKDPEGRQTVFEFLNKTFPGLPRLISIGRLDMNSEGLLLLTTSGALARKLELPSTGWKRRYRVRVWGQLSESDKRLLGKGLTVDGVTYGPIEAVQEDPAATSSNSWVLLTLGEGKNREIRNVMGHLNKPVNRLIRQSYGPFQLGSLPSGQLREVPLKVIKEQCSWFFEKKTEK